MNPNPFESAAFAPPLQRNGVVRAIAGLLALTLGAASLAFAGSVSLSVSVFGPAQWGVLALVFWLGGELLSLGYWLAFRSPAGRDTALHGFTGFCAWAFADYCRWL